ncbi:uncharacterized protein LOC123721580 [Papilio machaon]|uniref:uncharacterized protein LOC123721580 n=1 Tax=Papilio machaon TaxID=76193 RepID=UPI001E662E18|nr:uncharacterized protein LOC123721580 [Papilio machaon]
MKMIVKIQAISLIFQYSIVQYNDVLGYVQNYPDHSYDYHHYGNDHYDQPTRKIRKLSRHRKKIHRINGDRYLKRIKYRSSYEDYDCKCSCRNCAKLKQCCIEQCSECQNGANLMYVPYPVPVVIDVPSIIPPLPITPVTTKAPCSTTTTTTTIQTTVQTSSTQPPYLPDDKPCAALANCKENYDKRYYVRNNYQRLLSNRFDAYHDREIRPTVSIYEFSNNNKALRPKNRPWFSQNGYSPLRNNLAIKFGSEIRNYK